MQRAQVEPVIYLDLLEAGVDEGHRRGLVEGRVEGRVEGELHATRNILASLLRVRGFAPDAALERRIADAPLDQLLRWIERVPGALLPEDVFEGPTSPSP